MKKEKIWEKIDSVASSFDLDIILQVIQLEREYGPEYDEVRFSSHGYDPDRYQFEGLRDETEAEQQDRLEKASEQTERELFERLKLKYNT